MRKTTEQFIKDAIKVHGNKYDYSLVDYKTNDKNIKIICKIHGEFNQIASDHLRGCGCSQCSSNKRYTTQEFIEKSNIIHNYKFDYSLVNYKNNHTKIKIICPIHGVFEQKPNDHLRGHGCKHCYDDTNIKKQIFIDRSNVLHNNKYDYSLVNYINSYTDVIIICPVHGEFLQNPNNHMSQNGCPICNESKGELEIRNLLEKHNIKYEYQKTFDDCKHIKSLTFDFFLSDFNICIEYNGKQHYTPIEYFGGEKTLNEIIKRDTIKIEYCKNNNINLIVIKYDENNFSKILNFV